MLDLADPSAHDNSAACDCWPAVPLRASTQLMVDERNWEVEREIILARAAGRESLITGSFARVVGRALVPPHTDPAGAMWDLASVVVAHGTEPDPVFFYGNRAALTLFEMPARDFVRLPSRLSAEPLERAERDRLMAQVSRENLIDDYSGIRVSATGKRFRIDRAIVWNLLNAEGSVRGQAAAFSDWTALD